MNKIYGFEGEVTTLMYYSSVRSNALCNALLNMNKIYGFEGEVVL